MGFGSAAENMRYDHNGRTLIGQHGEACVYLDQSARTSFVSRLLALYVPHVFFRQHVDTAQRKAGSRMSTAWDKIGLQSGGENKGECEAL